MISLTYPHLRTTDVWYHQGRLLTLNTNRKETQHTWYRNKQFLHNKMLYSPKKCLKRTNEAAFQKVCSCHNSESWEPCRVWVSYTQTRSMILPSPLHPANRDTSACIGRRAAWTEDVSPVTSQESAGSQEPVRASIINRERITSRFFIADQFKSIGPETDSTQAQHKHRYIQKWVRMQCTMLSSSAIVSYRRELNRIWFLYFI